VPGSPRAVDPAAGPPRQRRSDCDRARYGRRLARRAAQLPRARRRRGLESADPPVGHKRAGVPRRREEAIRQPRRTRLVASAAEMSRRSPKVWARITPVRRNRSSYMRSVPAIAPVCETATLAPAQSTWPWRQRRACLPSPPWAQQRGISRDAGSLRCQRDDPRHRIGESTSSARLRPRLNQQEEGSVAASAPPSMRAVALVA